MRIADGKSILNGIAIGKLRIYRGRGFRLSLERGVSPREETARFELALQQVILQQRALAAETRERLGEAEAAIFEVHAMILEDALLTDSVRACLREEGCSAEKAVCTACRRQAQTFLDMDDPYMQARAADIHDIRQALLDALAGNAVELPEETEPVILVAEELTPSEIMRLGKGKLCGIITREGSCNSHSAILARSMNLPALVQCAEIDESWEGRSAILDGEQGRVYIDPEPGLLRHYETRIEQEREADERLRTLKGKVSVTRDGRQVTLLANIGGPEDIPALLQNDAEGVGLLRSEFLYLGRSEAPSEEEQLAAYREVLDAMRGRRVVIRTCDIGADKQLFYLPAEKEENPALGCRAIRFCFRHRELFRTQLRALLRASVYGRLAVMFPMIISPAELREAKRMLRSCREELEAEGVCAVEPQIGIMIETPAAVLCAEELAAECEFFSIGTNDLTQYLLALDRQNAALECFLDPHHPALLRAVEMTAKAGRKRGIEVGICGELAADLSLTERFLRMGISVLSVNPQNILPLRQKIRGLRLTD